MAPDTLIGSFAVLPYLCTSEPLYLCGFELHPASSIGHLPDVAKEHWKTLSAMFYLRDHLRITDPTLIYLPPEQDADRADVGRSLRVLQAYLAYLYTSPFTPDRTPYLRWEHTGLFWLRPAQISKHQIWQEHRSQNELPVEEHPAEDEWHNMMGYRGLLNGREDVEAVVGSRI